MQPEQPERHVISLAQDEPVYRILIVDDKLSNRQLLTKLLADVGPLSSETGFDIQDAANGQDAVAIWRSWQPHLIWMDMRMLVMDGFEATQIIKGTTQGQATAVIALTTSVLEEDRAIILSVGCNDFLRKPFKNADVFEMMTKHLGARFVYAQITETQAAKTAEIANIIPTHLHNLPKAWLDGLRQAADETDPDAADAIINEIRGENKQLADALANLAKEFRFDILRNLLEGVHDERQQTS